jgi:MinD-like ATPase involved in chromosome partitioning or flagellar assembly
MIIAVCSDKGAPGVTTLATVLGLVWPRGATVLEADPSGGDLTFRLRSSLSPSQDFLPTEPSVFTLAADARTGLTGGDVARYGQTSTLGVRVIPGPLRAERTASLRPLWPAVAQQLAQSSDPVIADLGRMQPGHAARSVAQAAIAVLVLARPDPEGLYHLRERVAQLAYELGVNSQARNPAAVVMLADPRERRTVLGQAGHMLEAAGLPIPVAGWMAHDRPAVTALRGGEMTRALRGSELVRSVTELTASMIRLWPQLQEAPASSVVGGFSGSSS